MQKSEPVLLRIELRDTIKMLILSVLVGILGALAAGIFHWLIEWSEVLFLNTIAGYDPPHEGGTPEVIGAYGTYLIPVATVVGALLSGLLVAMFAPEARAGGENKVIQAFHRSGGSIRARVPFVKAISSALIIGSGGAAGREGPIAQIVAGIGCSVGRIFKLSVPKRRTLVLAGAAAGVSAMFKTPLGGAFLAVEVLYNQLEIESDSLLSCIIASSVAYSFSGIFGGWNTLFDVGFVPPSESFMMLGNMFWYSILGVIAGLVSIFIPFWFYYVRGVFKRIAVPAAIKPALGAALLGLLGIVFPQVLGAGYGWMQLAIDGSLPVTLLFTLGILKIFAFSFTVSSGGSGGVFAPVLYSGAMFGSGLALLIVQIFGSGPDPTAMAVVGMAAFFAGVGRAPVATIIMAVELTGGYQLLVPTMISVSLAYIAEPLAARFLPETIPTLYQAQVSTRYESPTHHSEYVNAGLNLIREGGLGLDVPVSVPDLEKLLDLGRPIPIGNEGNFIYYAEIDSESLALDTLIRDLDVCQHILIASLFRSGETITPRGVTELKLGDKLVIIAKPEVEEQIRPYFKLQL